MAKQLITYSGQEINGSTKTLSQEHAKSRLDIGSEVK